MSTRIIAGNLWACAFKKNQHVVTITHSADASIKMLEERIKPMLRSCTLPLGAVERAGYIIFPATNSRYYVGTAGSKRFGRGDDITRFHLSEVAFWDDSTVLTSIEEACVDGAVGCIETTANGINFAQLMWKDAVEGKNKYKPIFLPWFLDDSNANPGARITSISEDEQKLISTYGLNHEQLSWRRDKIKSMSKPELFQQEYPSHADEAFLSSGKMVFDWPSLIHHEKECEEPRWRGFLRDVGEKVEFNPLDNGSLKVWKQPETRHVYAIGADVAEGIKDGAYSTALVLDIGTSEFVAEWHGHCSPSEFGKVLFDLGLYYNRAIVCPEAWPGPGSVTAAKLKDLNYSRLYRRGERDHDLGWETNVQSKQRMIGLFEEAIRNFKVSIKSKSLVSELRSYVYNETGKMLPTLGCFSDRIIGAAIAWTITRDLAETVNYDAPRLKEQFRGAIGGSLVSVPQWRGPVGGVRQ